VFSMLNIIRRIIKGALSSNQSKLDFLVGGVQKGGTTALDSYLRSHPEICLAETKEVHFFDNENMFCYPKILREWWYKSFFSTCRSNRVKGEVTPIYIWWHESIRRIYEYNPDIKLVFIFRDPAMRAYSHWNMETKKGNETCSFGECVRMYSDKRTTSQSQNRVFSYVERGFYSKQMENVYSFFRSEQVLCMKQEDLLQDPKTTLDKIAQHLGVSSFGEVDSKRVHALDYDSGIAPDDVKYLEEIYCVDIDKFERITGLDASQWKRHAV